MREKWKGELQGSEIIMTGIRERDCVIRREGGRRREKVCGKNGAAAPSLLFEIGAEKWNFIKGFFFFLL